MNIQRKHIAYSLLAAFIILAPVLPVFALPAGESFPRKVTVTGEGTVTAEPDIATVSIGVESLNRDIQKALAESREKINSIFEALVALGVSEQDMQTANYSFNFDRSSSFELSSSRNTGTANPVYRVNNTLSVTIRDLDLTGKIIDAAVLAGANEMWGVQFSIQETEPIIREATERAVADARSRAQYLASLNELSTGKLISINESTATSPLYAMERGLGGGVHPGAVSYTVRLTAVFELKE